jgi:GTP-binding protein
LKLYDAALTAKPRLVVANKMDLPESAGWLAKFRRRHRTAEVLEISCVTGEGLEQLKKELLKRVRKFRTAEKASQDAAV